VEGKMTMEEPYAIRQHDSLWIVCSREQEILTCSQLAVALRAVKEATDLLNYAWNADRGNSNNVVSYSESNLNAFQLVAHKHGFKIEPHNDKFYLRSIEPVTLQNSFRSDFTTPRNHLPFFRTLGEIRLFLLGA
jgi:hypothetical protein